MILLLFFVKFKILSHLNIVNDNIYILLLLCSYVIILATKYRAFATWKLIDYDKSPVYTCQRW